MTHDQASTEGGYQRQHPSWDYEKAPLKESIFEVRFEPRALDLVLPGRLYDRINKHFPLTETLNNPAGLLPEESGLPRIPLIRFYNDTRTLLCQLGAGMLSIHAVPPYHGFHETIKPAFDKIWTALRDLTGLSRVSRLGLRNLNVLELPPASELGLARYVRLGFGIVGGTPLSQVPVVGFNLRLDLAPHPGYALRIRLGTQRSKVISLTLDLDCFSQNLDPDRCPGWLPQAHDILVDTFEDALTQDAKALFGKARKVRVKKT